MEDEHILEAIGKTRVVVRNGRVEEVGDSLLSSCPLARRFSQPVEKMTKEAIKANIEDRIRRGGMCTGRREVLSDSDFVLFGASELLASGVEAGLIDAAIIACDGAGTVLASSSSLIQGIGGRMSGLIKTSPIPDVISRIEKVGGSVLFPDTAAIDMYRGVAESHKRGIIRIGVTTASPDEAFRIRSDYPEAIIFGVHLTGISAGDAETMVSACDIVSACASEHIRKSGGERALLQGGESIPVFALTQKGKEIMLEKIRSTATPVLIRRADLPFSGSKSPLPLL